MSASGSDDSFRLVADIAPVLIWMSDADARCNYVNASWTAFTGRTLDAVLRDGWRDSIHPDDLPRRLEVMTRGFERRQPFTAEYRLKRHDGEYRWVLDTAIPRFALDGALTGYVGSSVDITERKEAEASLRRKESELVEAQRLAAIGSWQWNAATDDIIWSDELYRIAGLEPGSPAVLGSNHPHLYPPEHWARIRRCADEAMRSGTPYELDVEMISGGSRRWVTARGEAQRDADGRITGLRGTVQDITERKQREESLGLFRTLIERSNDSLEIIDGQTLRFLDVNEKACRDLGYTREELLSLTVRDVNPNASQEALERIGRLCEQTGFALFESVHRRKDGSIFPVELNVKPVTLDDRRYYVTVCRDITERKRAEELSTSESRRLLEAQEAERARIARDLHDDIGQRLALLSIGLEQLQRSAANPASEMAESIDALRRQTLDISADVQALSHQLHSSRLQLLGVVPAIRGFCSEVSARQKVDVDFTHRDVPRTVRPDIAICLFRVLQEALQNAVRHSSATRFSVNLQGTPKAISLTVRDAGRGFDPASVSQHGGLGLTSMRERLKLVAGDLVIESQPALGTTIVARVPLPSGSARIPA
jgi:PAS domain S-box-containing protein